MFGYATDETPEAMPLTCLLAHQLNAKLAELRRDGTLGYLRPDSKTQVTQSNHMNHALLQSTIAVDEPMSFSKLFFLKTI